MPPLEKQTSAASNRRSNKPIMEKKRRARINNCLNELKSLLLEAMKKDPTRHSKLEKADILEMTVRHLQQLHQRQVALQVSTDPDVTTKYKAGFHECADEVTRYVSRLDGMEKGVKQRLLDHLTNCLTGLNTSTSPKSPPSGIYLNNRLLLNVTPSRLPTGDLALLLPREWSSSSFNSSSNNKTKAFNNNNNNGGGLLMTSSVDRFPPLTINCSNSSSPVPLSRTGSEGSPANSDYSNSDSLLSHSGHFENNLSHELTKGPQPRHLFARSDNLFANYSQPTHSHWAMDEDDMSLPVDLSSKDHDRMWRPW